MSKQSSLPRIAIDEDDHNRDWLRSSQKKSEQQKGAAKIKTPPKTSNRSKA